MLLRIVNDFHPSSFVNISFAIQMISHVIIAYLSEKQNHYNVFSIE